MAWLMFGLCGVGVLALDCRCCLSFLRRFSRRNKLRFCDLDLFGDSRLMSVCFILAVTWCLRFFSVSSLSRKIEMVDLISDLIAIQREIGDDCSSMSLTKGAIS